MYDFVLVLMGKKISKADRVIATLQEINPEAVVFDGFEEAVLGICYRYGSEPVIAYDRAACITKLILRDGMSPDEAEEFFVFNAEGCGAGSSTPVFVEV